MNSSSNRAPRFDALRDLDSLLAAAGAESVHELSEQVHQNEDVDMQVERTEHGILISTPTRGTELRFPFTWHEFWSVINDLEREFNDSNPACRPDPAPGRCASACRQT
jgi:hypothetical protein